MYISLLLIYSTCGLNRQYKKSITAKYSSQECNNCGHITKENRPNQETFKCVKCGHEGNADFEASLTIKKRGQSLLKL